jgi:hypothetical protein
MMIALTGQRRVGKSFVLRELAETIRTKTPAANIVYINKEKKDFDSIKDDSTLSVYVSDNVGQLVSATSLSKYLKSQRVELTPLSAINYSSFGFT